MNASDSHASVGAGSGARPRLAKPAAGSLPLLEIGVFRALQLGDMLCVVPALRALRAAHPEARITLIGLPWARDFAQRFRHYVDDFVAFPGIDGFPEREPDHAAMPAFIATMRARRFDLLLQMQGSGTLSNSLLGSFGARRVAGYCPGPESACDADDFLVWDEQRHEVLRYLALMESLGIPAHGQQLEFPLRDEDFAGLRAAAPGLRSDYVCIHPGARLPSRRWHPERFAAVARQLADAGHQIVLTGTAQESALAAELMQAFGAHGYALHRRDSLLDLSGHTTLGGMAALVALARLLVCNDTGASHVAVAVGTPSVVICSGADPHRWAPLDSTRHRVLWGAAACRPCMYVHCPWAGHPCASAVSTEQVVAAATDLLSAHVQAQRA